jgi:N,N'-diacetylbacillosaminyl-diphospho-undecaprenol alpha-1,3-N-acetylgalactosaminyltransferase
MGLPIVTTRSPGCVDVVSDGVNGFLVPGRDVQSLASAINRLVDCSETRRRFGDASRRHAVSRFDVKAVVQQTRTLYRGLLGNGHRANGRSSIRLS